MYQSFTTLSDPLGKIHCVIIEPIRFSVKSNITNTFLGKKKIVNSNYYFVIEADNVAVWMNSCENLPGNRVIPEARPVSQKRLSLLSKYSVAI